MKCRRGLSVLASVALVATVAGAGTAVASAGTAAASTGTAVASAGTAVATAGTVAASAGTAASASGGRATIAATEAPLARAATSTGAVDATAPVSFEVSLAYRDPAGAAAAARAVSDPSSPSFHHYFSAAAWEQRFSPTQTSVTRVTSWLRSDGLVVGTVTADRLDVRVSGTAAQVTRAFGVKLDNYDVKGRTTRLAVTDATVPAALGGIVSGVAGLSQVLETPESLSAGATPSTVTAPSTVAPPAGFRLPPICSKSWAARRDTTDPSYGPGYRSTLPYSICGYLPQQLQSAYGLTASYQKGITGRGVTVAVVDAYAAPTLLSDSQTYFAKNDPTQPFTTAQFSEQLSATFDLEDACGASDWYGEQTLDVQAVHATAPGATIVYAGAANCSSLALFSAVHNLVTADKVNEITDSWGDTAGDLLFSPSDRTAFDNVLMAAAAEGIGVQFSSGDSGDEFTATGLVSPDYPASSPWATAVGGTSLAVGATGKKVFESGWSTSTSTLCTNVAVTARACKKAKVGKYVPAAPGAYLYGGGGGTSYDYAEPSYQVGVVPAALANRNAGIASLIGNPAPARVVPDISMDADPATGMLVGETQAFPAGNYYQQYRIGGTSLASPLFAGVMALADQAALQRGATVLGFVNPVLYKSYRTGGSGIYDVVTRSRLAMTRVDYVNGISKRQGSLVSVRTLDYQGPESYCDGAGNCAKRPVTLTLAKGYDSMTGLGAPNPGFVAAISRY